MSSSDRFLSPASAPLFARRPPITAAPAFSHFLSLNSLQTRPNAPRLLSLPPASHRRQKRPSHAPFANSLSYHRPRLKNLRHRTLPRALLSNRPRAPRPYPHPTPNAWRLHQGKHPFHPPHELERLSFRIVGRLRRFYGLLPSASQIRSTTSRVSHQ
ncbi:hypothetical protein BDW72DRAFT_43242 [Aspergillus terricola var. indicus]